MEFIKTIVSLVWINDDDDTNSQRFGFFFTMIALIFFLPRLICELLYNRFIKKSKTTTNSFGLELFVRVFRFFMMNMTLDALHALICFPCSLGKSLAIKYPMNGCVVNEVTVNINNNDFTANLKAVWIGNKSWDIAKKNKDTTKVILYFHGGGYCFGSDAQYLPTHCEWIQKISKNSSLKKKNNDNNNDVYGILSVDYSLSPKFTYPRQVIEGLESFRWLLAQGISHKNIIIGGDSAGGGLTLVSALQAKDKSVPLPAGLILISPWADLRPKTTTTTIAKKLKNKSDTLTPQTLLFFSQKYLGKTDYPQKLTDPTVSPILDPTLPKLSIPTIIIWGDSEILADDCQKLGNALGQNCKVVHHPQMSHNYTLFPQNFGKPAQEALEEIVQFCSEKFVDEEKKK